MLCKPTGRHLIGRTVTVNLHTTAGEYRECVTSRTGCVAVVFEMWWWNFTVTLLSAPAYLILYHIAMSKND